MRYMDQVRTDGSVLTEISLSELVGLRRLLEALLDRAVDPSPQEVSAVYAWARSLEGIQLDAAADLNW